MSDKRMFITDDKGRLLVRQYLEDGSYVEKLWFPDDPDSLDDLNGYSELAQLFVTIEAELEKEKENDAV